jgi:hypothetical protein
MSESAELSLEPAHEPALVTIGDIVVSKSWVVTPTGTQRLTDVTWATSTLYWTSRRTPTWATVLAIIGAVFFLVGLLFLLVKEEKTVPRGVEVTVVGHGFIHVCVVPGGEIQVLDVMRRVNYAQSLAIAAS